MRRRRRNPDFRPTDLLVIGGGAYLIYQLINKAPAAVKTVTAPVAQKLADAWASLTLAPPMTGVLGDVILPDGTDQGPIAGLQLRMDDAGNVYLTDKGGALYQLGKSDANGNWPVQLVLDANFGTSGPGW